MRISNQTYERVTVHVPIKEVRKYKAVFKALGLEVEKKNAIDLAIDDIEAGRVNTYSSVDELILATRLETE